MARRSDSETHAEWRKRLERFARSGLTVARFCAREQVSVASFYHWRKKLGQTVSGRRTRSRLGLFRQVTVAAAPPAMAPGTPAVVRDTPAVDPVASAEVPAASDVSIHLPRGTRIDVPAAYLDAVRTVIGEVTRADRGSGAEPGPSYRSQTPHDESGVASC
jgi:hypothetical protein